MTKNQTPVVFRKGPRVTLRPLTKGDVPTITRWINDPEVTQFLLAYLPSSETEESGWVESLDKNKEKNVVLAIMVAGKFIGTIGIHNINWKDRIAITGTLIGEKSCWGKGYGTEAKMLLLDYAFNTLNLRKICSNVIAFNERSYRYSLSCGYKVEGRLKAHYFRKGQYWDSIQLSVFREDWSPIWEKFRKKHKLPAL